MHEVNQQEGEMFAFRRRGGGLTMGISHDDLQGVGLL